MEIDKIWESIFSYDTYKKGAMYSASDIVSEPLIAKLRKEHGSKGIKWNDKISSFIGTSIHSRIEEYIKAENEFGATNMESEVKLKFKNLSGTVDLILKEGKNHIICDFKTGAEKNIQKKIKNPDDWKVQLSIYHYLADKNGYKVAQNDSYGYIMWLCTDTNKNGVTKVELYSKKETIQLIKEFLFKMDGDVNDLPKCKLCIQFMHRWCGVRSHCPYWQEEGDMTKIDEW